eukprot:4514684-Prorocentrum_lima.AAC.1
MGAALPGGDLPQFGGVGPPDDWPSTGGGALPVLAPVVVEPIRGESSSTPSSRNTLATLPE